MRSNAHTESRQGTGVRGHIVAGILFTLAAGGIWFSVNRHNIQEYMETHKNREAEMAAIADLKQRISELKRKQQSLAYNGEESEKQIRERLPMHKPGERVIFFVEEGETETTNSLLQDRAGVLAPDSPSEIHKQSESSPGKAKATTGSSSTGQIQSVYDAM